MARKHCLDIHGNERVGGGCSCRMNEGNPCRLQWLLRMSKCGLCVACGDNEMESLLPRHRACGNRHKSPSGVDPFHTCKKRERRGKSVLEEEGSRWLPVWAFKIQNSQRRRLDDILAIQRRIGNLHINDPGGGGEKRAAVSNGAREMAR